ncbi:MAG: polyprenyl synthetase family protein, partial [Firmicutes bacterium]|nr:polyprenyl synthetase family protein [Bacillota bacterium]
AMRENYRNPWNEQEYLDVIRLKTAALFRASARIGAIAANASLDTKEIIGDFGELIGTAYQIADDITDITKSISEEVLLGDLKDGKATLPFIHLRERHPELAALLNSYNNGLDDYSQLKPVIAHMDDGIGYSMNKIDSLLNTANALLDHIPLVDGGRNILSSYGKYAVTSILKEVQ